MSRRDDPLGGNKNAHAVVSMYRRGMAPRWISKRLGLPLKFVNEAIAKTERRTV